MSKWAVLIGFKAEALPKIRLIVEKLKNEYPDQQYNVMNSKFPVYDFILCCFAETRDEAHKIGMALVKKHLPNDLCLQYWVKLQPYHSVAVTKGET